MPGLEHSKYPLQGSQGVEVRVRALQRCMLTHTPQVWPNDLVQ